MQNLSGTIWKLVEVRASDEDGHETEPPIPYPLGITMFGDERMLAAVTDTRSASDAPERVFFFYTGSYQWDGATLSTTADAASKPDMLRSMFEGCTSKVRHVW